MNYDAAIEAIRLAIVEQVYPVLIVILGAMAAFWLIVVVYVVVKRSVHIAAGENDECDDFALMVPDSGEPESVYTGDGSDLYEYGAVESEEDIDDEDDEEWVDSMN